MNSHLGKGKLMTHRYLARLAMLLRVTAALAVAAPFPQAYAESASWPSRPIKLISPSQAGSSTDYVGRLMANALSPIVHQPVIVENVAGAGGILGASALKAAAPDGHTLLLGGGSVSVANMAVYSKLPYDPVKDFDEVGRISTFTVVGLVKKDSPIQTVSDLVRLAKENPGKLSYG